MAILKAIPSSRAHLRVRASFFDVLLSLGAPALALWLRQTTIPDVDYMYMAGIYWGFSSLFSFCALLSFRLQDGLKRFFSVHDALDVAKAVILTELLVCIALFTVTRLEGIPRSTLFIHGVIFAGGLIAIRGVARFLEADRQLRSQPEHARSENVILIGSNHLAALFIRLLAAAAPSQRVVAILDDSPAMIGRILAGVPIVASPDALATTIEEFAVHGIEIGRVVIAGGDDLLSKPALSEVQAVCLDQEISLDFVAQMLGVDAPRTTTRELAIASADPSSRPSDSRAARIAVPAYFRVKRVMDFVTAVFAIIVLFPLILGVAGLVLLDVGSPVLFWQQRLGRNGRPFLVYKFRTLQAPFDRMGCPMPEHQRESSIGYLLRKTGLDELPQLLNVLIGDMSLIGPRPLLPHDQPPNPAVRLLVRPGITGWAQVNGAKSLTPLEKDSLDESYIRAASIWFDLRIVFMTFKYVFGGERQPIDLLALPKNEKTVDRQRVRGTSEGRRVA